MRTTPRRDELVGQRLQPGVAERRVAAADEVEVTAQDAVGVDLGARARPAASSAASPSAPKRSSAAAVVKSFSLDAGASARLSRWREEDVAGGERRRRRRRRPGRGGGGASSASSAGRHGRPRGPAGTATASASSATSASRGRRRRTAGTVAGRSGHVSGRPVPTSGGSCGYARYDSSMGKVVKLESAAARQGATPRRRRPRRRSKTALVLGGGGFTGGVYEIGALRALDLLSVNRTVNQFDVYVGTSAGSFVAALAANGVTPEEMMRVVNQQVPTPFRDIDLGQLLRPNLVEYVTQGRRAAVEGRSVAARARAAARRRCRSWTSRSASPRALPSRRLLGLRASSPTCAPCCRDPDRSDDFRLLEPELYLAATDLDTCERIVFGADDWDDVPISTAVARVDRAADGLQAGPGPRPRADRRRHRLDDQRRHRRRGRAPSSSSWSTRSCPTSTTSPSGSSGLFGSRPRHVSDMGLPQIGYQAFKLMAYQRLHEMAKQWEERYPGVDIVLIEPEPNDELMFQTSIMNFTKRVDIARHGFQSVTLKLAEDYEQLPDGSASATGSRSPPRGCARSSSTSRPSRRRPGRGARSSSRRPGRCCASRTPGPRRSRRNFATSVGFLRARCQGSSPS